MPGAARSRLETPKNPPDQQEAPAAAQHRQQPARATRKRRQRLKVRRIKLPKNTVFRRGEKFKSRRQNGH